MRRFWRYGLSRHPLFLTVLLTAMAAAGLLAARELLVGQVIGLLQAEMAGSLAVAACLIGLLALYLQRRAMLRQGHERLSEAVDALSEGFALYDADDRLVLCNRTFREIYDRAAHMVVPGVKFATMVRYAAAHGQFPLPDDQIDAFVARRCREHRDPGLPSEQKLANGRWVQVSERRTRQGGTVGVRADITALKRAEEALRDALEAAERANRAKSRFLAAASHDLRQPLHAIGMFVGALAERVQGREAGEIIGNLRTTLGVLENLLNALLDISKLDAGVIEPEIREVALAPLLDRLRAEFRPQARAKGLDFRVVSCSASVRTDPTLLESLVRNLLSNALRYTLQGRVVLGCRRWRGGIRLEVWDTGVGIPADCIGDIFQEFHRLENGVAGAPGAGLGLTIVERTVHLLKHRLSVRSKVDSGSVFALELPLVRHRTEPAATEPWVEATRNPLGGSTVLVIDDDQAVLEGMRRLLSGWGCTVVTAVSTEQALALVNGVAPPHLIVADYRLRSGTGVEAVLRLRQVLGREVPAVIVTGDTSLGHPGECEAAGLPLLLKPVQPAKLRALLSFALGRSARRGEGIAADALFDAVPRHEPAGVDRVDS